MTLAISKMDGHGLINTTHRECLPKKTKVTWYTSYRKTIQKMECFSEKGEGANV